jgi:hypothetical protein
MYPTHLASLICSRPPQICPSFQSPYDISLEKHTHAHTHTHKIELGYNVMKGTEYFVSL